MAAQETNRLLDGRAEPPPAGVILHAGPVTVRYAGGDIRYVQVGTCEILRRVYAAVRDPNWRTILPRLQHEQIVQEADSFVVTFEAVHAEGPVDFVWQGRITGAPDGTIQFTFDGEARSTFRRNRIGFCVLHPDACAGRPCDVLHVDGTTETTHFPLYIAPHQPIFAIRALTHELRPGLSAEVHMAGDTFEMEDQRNWTDASYKTYCTPLGRPYPVVIEQGMRVRQAITIRLLGDLTGIEAGSDAPLTLRITDQAVPLPTLGLGLPYHGEALTEIEQARLKALNLGHLRLDLRLNEVDWEAALRQAVDVARAVGTRLEIALFLSDAAAAELDALRSVLDVLHPPLARWLIFAVDQPTTPAALATLTRAKLESYSAPIGVGTDHFFTQLNRQRPPVEAADFLTYSLNPQVHAFEDLDLIETLPVQAVTVASAQQFSGGKPVVVSPVTLKMRHNPDATGPQPEPPTGELPPTVDVRQLALFGAVWTLGSLKALAEGGAQAVTYYETTGWRGVMERAAGSPLPEQFPALPGGVFPLYHVLAAVGAFAGGEVIRSQSSAARVVDGLVLRQAGQLRILLANFTREMQTVTLPEVQGPVVVRQLDVTNAIQAMRDPKAFRQEAGAPVEAGTAGLAVTLRAYAVAWVERDRR